VNPIPGPIILLALPALAAIAVYMLRRWAFPSAIVSILVTAGLAILCFELPLDRSAFVLGQEVAFGRPVVILGQTLVLAPAGQAWLAFVFALAPAFFVFAWRIPQGRSFFPFSLIILALYALTTLLQTFELSLLVFAVSTTVAVFIIQGGRPSSVRGAQRYVAVTLLAVPLLLASAWLLGNPAQVPSSRAALLLAGLGFGLLLAAFPFGTWMPALAADAPPMVTAFIFTAGQAMALFLALTFLRDTPGILGESTAADVIRLAALVMAASGGLMAAVQRDFGRLFGYAALSDLGILLLAFGTGRSQDLTLLLIFTADRSIAIILMAASLAILRHGAATDRFSELSGIAQRLPVATAGLMLGGLALAGFPITAGFPVHWAVYRNVWNWVQPFSPTGSVSAPAETWVLGLTLFALVASSAGVIVGLFRGLGAMLGGQDRTELGHQPVIASAMVLMLGALVILLGIYPQLLLTPVQNVVQAIPLF
jgi:formate hydrogenlyase subunit 3/multisubunit Na+/H+ antiporter MnhD subunit